MSIGARIETRLGHLGWSQSKLARELKLSSTTINSIIRSGARMTPHLVRIAKALGTTPAYLTGETDNPDAEVLLPELSYEQRQLLACFEALDDTGRQLVLAMAMRLAGMDGPGRVQNPQREYYGEREKAG